MSQPYPQRPQPMPRPQPAVVVQHSRNTLIAYLLWFFLGMFGVHKMYVGKWAMGLVYLLLTVVGGATTAILIGFIPLGIWALLWLLDLFTLPGQVRRANAREAARTYGMPTVRTF